MGQPSLQDVLVQAAWAAHRSYLLAVAAAMLKQRDDAEDVVQKAFARLAAVAPEAIEDVRDGSWLSPAGCTLTGLPGRQSADDRHRRTARGAWVSVPEDRVMVHDEVRHALSVVIDRLSPGERTTFILHDIFGFPSTPWPGSSGASL